MLQDAWSGNHAFLGNMANQEQGCTALLGEANQLSCAFADLRDRTRRGLQPLGEYGLDRINDHNLRFFLCRSGQNQFNAGFRHQP